MSLDLPRAGGPVLDLLLERGPGGVTRIARRRVAWPWSLPRGYALGGPEGCLTLVPQAAGAALMPGDIWEQRLTLGPGAAARLVTAGATAVHGPGGAETIWRLSLAPGAWLAMLPDPAVLFEGAALRQTVEADLGPGAVLILADGVCLRAPDVRPLGWTSRLVVTGPEGTILTERQEAGPESFPRLARLPDAPAAFGSLTAFGAFPAEPGPLDLPGCYAAAGLLRGGAGMTARIAAPSGGALSSALRRLAAAWAPRFEPRL
ncbi:MAG: urease accessory protein UreD [Pikeienuella sp.]|uniref:urease accessory protein UreD n=1 Tax=Pikeienuella sp. TaxID=2831957 RepID=UPI00391B03D5